MSDLCGRECPDDFEELVRFDEPRLGVRGVVAIHSTALGPALGGVRFRRYGRHDDALADAEKLARGMTYKAAAAGLDLGGGKAVIDGDPTRTDRSAVMQAFGRVVESLAGRYITAEDVGTTVADMAAVAAETTYVVGLAADGGGLGDPSPSTARGVVAAMQAALLHLDGDGDLAGRRVAVMGLGKVGSALARLLVQAGVQVVVADLDPTLVDRARRELGVDVAPCASIHELRCDVFAPCALGGILDTQTIPELGCRAVVGAANNQLADPRCAEVLREQGRVYVPDFVANAGGLIHVALERTATLDQVAERVLELGPRTSSILALADASGVSTHRAAEQLAERRLAEVRPTTPVATGAPGGIMGHAR